MSTSAENPYLPMRDESMKDGRTYDYSEVIKRPRAVAFGIVTL